MNRNRLLRSPVSLLIFAVLSIIIFLSSAQAGILTSHMQSNASMIPTASAELASPTTALEGTLWLLLTYVDSQGMETKVLPGSEVTATFENNTIEGNAGCNNYFGSYQTNGNQLSVKVGGITMMYCDQLMGQEQAYILALGNSSSYEIIDNELIIYDQRGQPILTYRVFEPLPLNNTTWNLIFYNNGKGALTSPLLGTNITTIFDQSGTMGGTTGCNEYNSNFMTSGDVMEIGPIGATRMYCSEPDGVMEQESSYLQALSLTKYYSIQGDELELMDGNSTKMAIYRAEHPE